MEHTSDNLQLQRTPDEQEALNAIALTRMDYFSLVVLRELYARLGSATAVVENRHRIRELFPDASDRVVRAFANMDEALARAEAEYRWAVDNHIQMLAINDPRYPRRMAECPDAPLVVYYRGTADLNATRVISVVGMRRSTTYGHDILRRFFADLRLACPGVLVVSGLAYGIDIHAHREALANGFPTVGVLAHGLDRIYPTAHRTTAVEMLSNGGLLTEYPSQTAMAKGNFVQRNRIVAGMCDACIVVESAEKGGGLITMNIANDYNRDCLAFPGAVDREQSKGCNNLIRDNKASLISSADDFLRVVGWKTDTQLNKARRKGIERQMFPDLSDDERLVVDTLSRDNDQSLNMLSVNTGIAMGKLSSVLFYLEMKGLLKTMAGGTYHMF